MNRIIIVICVMTLTGLMSCRTNQMTQQDPQTQKYNDNSTNSDNQEASASPDNDEAQSHLENQNTNSVQNCFRNKPPWVTTPDYTIHGNKILTIYIDIETTKVFSQIKRPSDEQMRKLKNRCANNSCELIDYFWYGHTDINRLYGLCLDKKDPVQDVPVKEL
jgi:hypothetical protein